MMEQSRLNQLLNKYQQNSLSDAEKQELDNWFHQLNYQSKKADEWLIDPDTSEEMFFSFQNRLAHIRKNRRIIKMRRLVAAAAILLIVSAVGIFYFNRHESTQNLAQFQKQQVRDILPGSNKATLTLGNGRRIDLTDGGNKHIASDGGAQITKSADGQLLYSNSTTSMPDPALNTVSTPVGGAISVNTCRWY
ncbi:MAG: hypothetical protein JKY70_09535 [Mucilaginibacter sp.]|nr:hypothetical protein [Mucilaginibacter sp.]